MPKKQKKQPKTFDIYVDTTALKEGLEGVAKQAEAYARTRRPAAMACSPKVDSTECGCPPWTAIDPGPVVNNRVTLDLPEGGTPRLIVNGVDLAAACEPDWTLRNVVEDGIRTAYLTVTFPVILP